MDTRYPFNPEPAEPDYYYDLGFPTFDDEHAYFEAGYIKAAWLKLVKRHHPDKKGPGEDGNAAEFRRKKQTKRSKGKESFVTGGNDMEPIDIRNAWPNGTAVKPKEWRKNRKESRGRDGPRKGPRVLHGDLESKERTPVGGGFGGSCGLKGKRGNTSGLEGKKNAKGKNGRGDNGQGGTRKAFGGLKMIHGGKHFRHKSTFWGFMRWRERAPRQTLKTSLRVWHQSRHRMTADTHSLAGKRESRAGWAGPGSVPSVMAERALSARNTT
ncbi:hypothetical protein QBC36DRAFT_344891 [Triangularia setosa]|uniref:J domain-containing protein n=1 Tax=Triangularia setosa TaxID=2587417 RepID=A0AAN6WBK2_9PEZI|nr:hypothetical protein QBC36DRAFT_344891 [Podospora setosa]